MMSKVLTITLSLHVLAVHVKARQCTKCYRKFSGTVKALDRHEQECEANAAPYNLVRREVLEFSAQIEGCEDLITLNEILHLGGIKRFDHLDGTDSTRTPPFSFSHN